MRRAIKKALGVVLAAGIVVSALALPGAGIDAQAAKKTTKTSKTTATAAVPTNPVVVNAALIQGGQVVVTASSASVPATDDGIFHLYAQEVYESGTQGKEIAQAPAGANAVFQFALNKNTANSNLYKKFTVVIVSGGTLKAVSNAQYITNPEATTEKTAARYDGGGKKGLLLEAHLIDKTNYLTDLGIDQITYNLPLGNLCQNGNMKYTYNGKDYYFNSGIVGQYDLIVPKMNRLGISVTLILLNNLTGDATLLHPLSRDNLTANYYAFNTADAAGVEKLEAIAAFLGERYSGAHGTVDNWIVGNEVNARAEWNYINPAVGLDGAAAEYSKALRIFYNGIKSKNANARIYAGVDHEWAVSDNEPLHYAGKLFLQSMNGYISAEGNFNYGIATHPYNVPLYNTQTWNPSIKNSVTQSADTMYITMANIGVLTDFFCQKEYLQTDGQVRSILCSEVGYTSIPFGGYISDENQQAAALAFGYLQAANNQHIDGFFNREVDAPEEIVSSGLAMGVLTTGDYITFTPKLAYNTYKFIDHPSQSAAYMAVSSAAIGQDITTLITPR